MHEPRPTEALQQAQLHAARDGRYHRENPEQAKELLRQLIKDIQVHDRRRIIPTYRIPAAVRAIPRKVEAAGIEPASAAAPAEHLQA